MSEHTPLKPCPFCGGVEVKTIFDMAYRWFHAGCSCGAHGPCKETEADAIAAWNRRAPGPVRDELVKALEAALRDADWGLTEGDQLPPWVESARAAIAKATDLSA